MENNQEEFLLTIGGIILNDFDSLHHNSRQSTYTHVNQLKKNISTIRSFHTQFYSKSLLTGASFFNAGACTAK